MRKRPERKLIFFDKERKLIRFKDGRKLNQHMINNDKLQTNRATKVSVDSIIYLRKLTTLMLNGESSFT